jgi:plasmid stability protein
MANIVIRSFDDSLKERLRVRAAGHGHSMEDEVKEILQGVLNAQESPVGNLAAAIRSRVLKAPGIEAQPLPRQKMKAPPEFD